MMKWWGWGSNEFEFPIHEKPGLWPWVRDRLGIDVETRTPPVPRSAIREAIKP